MKSEKARQELEDGSWKVEVGYEGEDVDSPYHAVRVDVAQYAVELAEQEAEERMREKAKRAFECVWNATPKQVAEECGADGIGKYYYQDFVHVDVRGYEARWSDMD